MANPAMVVRIAANLDEFKRNLAEGRNQIETTTAAMKKIEASLNGDKLIQKAHNVAAAVNAIGGASKLTAAEQERVNKVVTAALEKYQAMGKEAPAALRQIANETKRADPPTQSWLGGVSKLYSLWSAFMALGVVTWFTGVIKSMIQSADELTKLSAITRINVETLQRLGNVAQESGNTLDDLTRAITAMQDRMASGNKDFVKALETINVDLEHLRRLKPEDQLIAIAEAWNKIPDPAQRAQLAIDLFGRTGAEIIPTLSVNIRELANGTAVMSAQTVETLDRAGDAWDKFWNRTKIAVANVTAVTLEWLEFAARMPAANAALMGHMGETPTLPGPAFTPGALPLPAGPNAAETTRQQHALSEHLAKLREAAAAAKKTAEEHARLAERLRETERSAVIAAFGFRATQDALDDLGGEVVELSGEWTKLRGQFSEAHKTELKAVQAEIKKTGDALKEAEHQAFSFAGSLRSIWEGMSGGDGVRGFLENLGQGFMDGIGNLLTGGISSLIGGGISFIGNAIGGLFRDEQAEQVNDLRDAFQATFGSLHDMNVAAQEAGLTLDRLLAADKVHEFNAAVDELTEAIAFQEDSMRLLEEAAQAYGFTVEELGPAFAAQKLDEQAQTLFQHWTALNAAGVDTNAILARMGPHVSEFVQTSIRAGVEIPAAMRPMIEQMIQAGTLLDANGNAITDMESAGITFSQTMTEGFRSIVDEVKRLTEAIMRGLGIDAPNAAAQGAAAIESAYGGLAFTIPINYDLAGIPDPSTLGLPLEMMAEGGAGTVDRPTLFMAGEAGPEQFAFSGANRSFAEGGTSLSTAAMEAELSGLREDLARDRRMLPHLIGVEMRDQLAALRR